MDYHDEMNSEHFENWWELKVLPALPDKSAVIIDNARYHSRLTKESKKPTSNWRKNEIEVWLQKYGVPTSNQTKVELLVQSKNVHVYQEYILEKITREFCQQHNKSIEIVRLPVGHSR